MKHTHPDAWKGEQFIRAPEREPGAPDATAPNGRCKIRTCGTPLSYGNESGYCRNHVSHVRKKPSRRGRKPAWDS